MSILDNTTNLRLLIDKANNLSNPDNSTSEYLLQSKTISPTTLQQTITPDNGYDGLKSITVNAIPTTTLATPRISISSAGKITVTVNQAKGYISKGLKSATKQLATQAAKTITPTISNQTAVTSGVFTTGVITVKGDENLVASNIKNGVSIFGVTGTYGESSSNSASTLTGINADIIGSFTYLNETFKFIKGMTWGEFIASDMNSWEESNLTQHFTGNSQIYTEDIGGGLISNYYVTTDGTYCVTSSDLIIDGYNYIGRDIFA